MGRVAAKQLFEAEDLLEKVRSWTEDEIEALPDLYERKARKYRRLTE